MSLIQLSDITKTYDADPPIPVLTGINLAVEAGEKVSIVGRSGAGKSTLLNILGLLDAPSSGEYMLNGDHVENLPENKRDHIRAQVMGFVFQDFHILGHRTVAENLSLKLAISAVPTNERAHLIDEALDTVGLIARSNAPARLLSGGEKQRLAIARALITSPQIILADEPTGNLDKANTDAVLQLFNAAARRDVAVLVITHDDRLSEWADRVIALDNGRLHAR